MSTFKMRTNLLKAIAACACTMQDGKDRIAGIVFRDGEIIASNGHVLVRVPAKHELSLMMPTELAIAACEASLSGSDGQVDEFGYPVDAKCEVVISSEGEYVCVDVGGVTLRAAAANLSKYPDINLCVAKSNGDGNAMGTLFDPRKLALFGDVLDATSYSEGIALVACGGPLDALVFKSDSGVTMTLMPMARRDK
jgi:hypothetical protein